VTWPFAYLGGFRRGSNTSAVGMLRPELGEDLKDNDYCLNGICTNDDNVYRQIGL
jgi:hypothetical protein